MIRNTATISSLTLLSRIMGFIRQSLMAALLGASAAADAFWVAFRLPMMLRRMLAEGAMHAALVPLLHRHEQLGEEAAADFITGVVLGILLLLCFLTTLVFIFSPFVLWLLAGGFFADAEKTGLTELYMRVMFPYLMLMSLTGVFSAVLNARHRFTASSFFPVLFNLAMITALLVARGEPTPQLGLALCVGVLCGGVGQLGMVYIAMRRSGVRLRRPRWVSLRAFAKVMRLGAPGFIAVGAMQVNIAVASHITSRQGGAVTWLTNADQIATLPLALIGIALGTVILSSLSRAHKNADEAGAHRLLNRALEMGMLLGLPAALGLIFLAPMIINVLFGDLALFLTRLMGMKETLYKSGDIAATSLILTIIALGTPALVAKKILAPAFFAREDLLTPMYAALLSVAVNALCAFGLYSHMGYLSVVVAMGVSAWLEMVILVAILLRKRFMVPDALFFRRAARILCCCVVLAGFLWGIAASDLLVMLGTGMRWMGLFLTIAAGMALYGVCALLLRLVTVDMVRHMIRGPRI